MNVILLEHPTDDDWMGVKVRNLVTIGKRAVNPPDDTYKKRMLMARHSTIRYLRFSFYLEDIPYYVSTHLVRHIHAQPYVKSQRNDRQSDYDRTKAPQDAPVNMIWDMNAEEFLTICNKRLCMTASPETREVVKKMCELVGESNPEFEQFMVPTCEYHGGVCQEFYSCGRYPMQEIINSDG